MPLFGTTTGALDRVGFSHPRVLLVLLVVVRSHPVTVERREDELREVCGLEIGDRSVVLLGEDPDPLRVSGAPHDDKYPVRPVLILSDRLRTGRGLLL